MVWKELAIVISNESWFKKKKEKWGLIITVEGNHLVITSPSNAT
jgi:hypothetical protein